MRLLTSFALLIFLFTSCSTEDFHGLDVKQWKDDKGGCSGYRAEAVGILRTNQDELLAMNVKELRGLLGNPDRHELEKRNSRRFTYFTAKDVHCQAENPGTETPNITVRIGPLGEVVEVTFYNMEN